MSAGVNGSFREVSMSLLLLLLLLLLFLADKVHVLV